MAVEHNNAPTSFIRKKPYFIYKGIQFLKKGYLQYTNNYDLTLTCNAHCKTTKLKVYKN